MATVKKWVAAPVDDVWAVLADARSYAYWVVGSHDIRKVDGPWPQVGSTFHHTQGHGPFKLGDTTTVVECEPPRRLLLEVRIRPFLVGLVEFTLKPDGEGTCISIMERAEGGLAGVVPDFMLAPLIGLRNADALRRLAGMAWARSAALGRTPDDADGASNGSGAAGQVADPDAIAMTSDRAVAGDEKDDIPAELVGAPRLLRGPASRPAQVLAHLAALPIRALARERAPAVDDPSPLHPGDAPPTSGKLLLLFDGGCGICLHARDVFGALDRRHHLAFDRIARHDQGLLADIPPADRYGSWHVVHPDGRMEHGSAGVAAAIGELPGGGLPERLIRRFPRPSDAAYEWFVRNRGWISRGSGLINHPQRDPREQLSNPRHDEVVAR